MSITISHYFPDPYGLAVAEPNVPAFVSIDGLQQPPRAVCIGDAVTLQLVHTVACENLDVPSISQYPVRFRATRSTTVYHRNTRYIPPAARAGCVLSEINSGGSVFLLTERGGLDRMPSSLIPALKRLALIDHLTVRQALLLLALAEAPVEQRTVGAQAQAMGIPQQSVSRAAAALFRLGLIYRQRHGSNARAVLLTVSDEGLRLLAEVGRNLGN